MAGPTIHQSPPKGEGAMSCCGKMPLEASRAHRITIHPHLVTCNEPDDKAPYADDPRIEPKHDNLYLVFGTRRLWVVQLGNGHWAVVPARRPHAEDGEDCQSYLHRQPRHPPRDVAFHSAIGAPIRLSR